jgi:hypothetical protein
MISKPEDQRIDFRPRSQFYGRGYLVVTLICFVFVLWLLLG